MRPPTRVSLRGNCVGGEPRATGRCRSRGRLVAGIVAEAIAGGTAISAVNLAEVLGRAGDRGAEPTKLAQGLRRRGLLDGAITVEPLSAADAVEVARLRAPTRMAGLGLGDRACLALARRLDAAALTADAAWTRVALDVEVRQIR